MNHNCNGDFFKAGRILWYRCFRGSSVIRALNTDMHGDDGLICTVCNREIEASSHDQEVEIKTKAYVVIQGHEWYLPESFNPNVNNED